MSIQEEEASLLLLFRFGAAVPLKFVIDKDLVVVANLVVTKVEGFPLFTIVEAGGSVDEGKFNTDVVICN